MILVFGILGLLGCLPLGIAAWIMGSRDLKEMDGGSMDPSGRSNTKAGQVCGIIGTILSVLGFLAGVAMLLLGVLAGMSQ